MSPVLISYSELRAKGITQGKTQLWRNERAGKFPKRVRVFSRVCWIENEIDAWIAARIAERKKAA